MSTTIATEGMQVSDVKDSLRIHQLPLNGRFVTNLFDLTAGVEGGGNPRVNGLKVGSADMLLDGVSLVNRFGGGIMQVQPGLDTIQEYRIETAGSGAQYSRPATVSLVTKSGTNELHGSLFETHRNNFGGLRARARRISTRLRHSSFATSSARRSEAASSRTRPFGSEPTRAKGCGRRILRGLRRRPMPCGMAISAMPLTRTAYLSPSTIPSPRLLTGPVPPFRTTRFLRASFHPMHP